MRSRIRSRPSEFKIRNSSIQFSPFSYLVNSAQLTSARWSPELASGSCSLLRDCDSLVQRICQAQIIDRDRPKSGGHAVFGKTDDLVVKILSGNIAFRKFLPPGF